MARRVWRTLEEGNSHLSRRRLSLRVEALKQCYRIPIIRGASPGGDRAPFEAADGVPIHQESILSIWK